jgi:hypothetical protein
MAKLTAERSYHLVEVNDDPHRPLHLIEAKYARGRYRSLWYHAADGGQDAAVNALDGEFGLK